MRHRVVVLLAFGVLLTCPVSRVPCPTVDAEEWKVGYVDLAKAFDGYERTQASDTELEKKGKQKEAELEGRVNELKKLREHLELLNDASREAKLREIEAKTDEVKRFRANTARELRRERDEVARSILQEVHQIVADYAKANGFSMILDERQILYGQPGDDVTDAVLKQLNSRYHARR